MEYVVILEKGDTSFGAYVPDLPGCVAVGETKDEAMQLIREAIEMHLESLRERGERVPEPLSSAKLVIVPAEPEITLESLVEEITDDNRHDEIETGKRVGSEVW